MPALSLLLKKPVVLQEGGTFTTQQTFLLNASFCMDEVLDPAITKLLIDILSKECCKKNGFEDENGSRLKLLISLYKLLGSFHS